MYLNIWKQKITLLQHSHNTVATTGRKHQNRHVIRCHVFEKFLVAAFQCIPEFSGFFVDFVEIQFETPVNIDQSNWKKWKCFLGANTYITIIYRNISLVAVHHSTIYGIFSGMDIEGFNSIGKYFANNCLHISLFSCGIDLHLCNRPKLDGTGSPFGRLFLVTV